MLNSVMFFFAIIIALVTFFMTYAVGPAVKIYYFTMRTFSGMVRVGAAHYNTLDEVARFGGALMKVAKS